MPSVGHAIGYSQVILCFSRHKGQIINCPGIAIAVATVCAFVSHADVITALLRQGSRHGIGCIYRGKVIYIDVNSFHVDFAGIPSITNLIVDVAAVIVFAVHLGEPDVDKGSRVATRNWRQLKPSMDVARTVGSKHCHEHEAIVIARNAAVHEGEDVGAEVCLLAKRGVAVVYEERGGVAHTLPVQLGFSLTMPCEGVELISVVGRHIGINHLIAFHLTGIPSGDALHLVCTEAEATDGVRSIYARYRY